MNLRKKATVVAITAILVIASLADVVQPVSATGAEMGQMDPMETFAPTELEPQEIFEVEGLLTAAPSTGGSIQLLEDIYVEEPTDTAEIEAEAEMEAEKTEEEAWNARIQAKSEEWQQEIVRQAEEARRIKEERRLAKIRARKLARARARTRAIAKAKAKELKRQNAQQELFAGVASEERLLAIVIELEVGSSSRTDKIGCGSVILNRLRTTYSNFRYLHSIHDVIYSPGQYGCLKGIPNCKPSAEAKEVAHGLLYGEIEIWPEKVLYQTTYRQSWMDGKVGTYEVANVGEYYGYPLDFEEGCK